jgi:16S rRNA (cytosine1402-N4)-methyltransferase
MSDEHITVLLEPAVQALVHDPAGSYVDGTFGRGGHSRAILQNLSAQGRLLACDKDPQAIAAGAAIQDARFELRHTSFSALMRDAAVGTLSGVLLDLGVSSPQIDQADRGFSFRFEGPLDMRMDPTRGQSVSQWLANADVQQITEVIRAYGEERFAGPIAKAIVARRQAGHGLDTTQALADLVAQVVKTREHGQHPATRTFQAFRIHINAELEELEQVLTDSLRALRVGAKLVVISFHSLEDRMVKQFMQKHAKQVVDRRHPMTVEQPLMLEALQRVRADAHEVARNPRARSAVMRVATRTGVAWS